MSVQDEFICNSFWGGLSPSGPSQFAGARVLDRTPDTNPWPHSHELQISLRELTLCAKNWLTFLPQMGLEDLDQADLEGGDLAMHEYTGQVELYLETNVDVCSIDRQAPPQHETTIRNLVETRTLHVGELLVSHWLFETWCLLPEETLPHREVHSLEQCVPIYLPHHPTQQWRRHNSCWATTVYHRDIAMSTRIYCDQL